MNNDNGNDFKITDIVLAGFLITRGHDLVRVETAGRQGIFIFRKDQVNTDSLSFLQGDARVEPSSFNLSIKRLKGELDKAFAG